MKLAVLVIGDGRGPMLHQTVRSITQHVAHPITARIMVDDSGDLDYGLYLDDTYPEYAMVHGGRRGMAGAVQAGFDAALSVDPDYVLWCEEDHLITRALPITKAITALESHTNLAQMVFPREPCDPSEGTDQLAAVLSHATFTGTTDLYTTHDFLFSFVPCLIPRRILTLTGPASPAGIETTMTQRCLEAGYIFGAWGHVGDEPYVRHIGYAARSAEWAL